MNSQISLYADSLDTATGSAGALRAAGFPKPVEPAAPRVASLQPLRSNPLTRKKGLHNSVGLVITVGLHIVALAVLLSSRIAPEPQPMPIMARVLSDQKAEQPKEEIKHAEPVLQKPQLFMPQPEIILASEPSPNAPVAVTQAAPKREEAPQQVVDSIPRFDADYLDNPKPNYPPLSKRLREQGIVLVRVHVMPNGLPDQVELKRTSGSARLDDSALAAVKRWKFVPATSAGAAVAAWVVVPIAFSLNT